MSLLELEKAWHWREEKGVIAKAGSARVFHGPGEGSRDFRNISIDRFCDAKSGAAHFWLTEWQESKKPSLSPHDLNAICEFLAAQGASSAVALLRPEKGVPSEPRVILGEPPLRFIAREGSGKNGALFRIQLQAVKHPGLFLDHYPLRQWLRAHSQGLEVLNTFSYTGSLSVACGLGGASHVTTLDLSATTVGWARENWALNSLSESRSQFLSGDYFEWLPRLKRQDRKFDLLILDPPSFSRSKKGTFSTSKDLRKLHELAFAVLKSGAFLVTSINSANVHIDDYAEEVKQAAEFAGVELEIINEIQLPETFPGESYLKGWTLRISSGKGASKRIGA